MDPPPPPWPWAAILMGLLIVGCSQSPSKTGDSEPSQPPQGSQPIPEWWKDATEAWNLHFVHQTGASGDYLMPEQIGSGCALFDYNKDGLLDLYFLQNGAPANRSTNQLFRQIPGGRFENVTTGSGLDLSGRGMGVAVGDVNNDGWEDVLVTEYGSIRLFLNLQGRGTFTEVTVPASLDNPRWATAAAFFDYDRDGWLDLVVGNYIDYDPTHQCYNALGQLDYCGPKDAPIVSSRLYRNLGSDLPEEIAVRFSDTTISSGLVNHPGPALGIVCLDFNRDQWPDVLFADDERPNRLFINQQNGTFREEAALRGLAYTLLGQVAADMGVAIGDVDRNGLFDVFITHLTEEFHNIWFQESPGFFQDRTGPSGLTHTAWRGTGFGAILADFDHDGPPDIALVNGRIKGILNPDPPLEVRPEQAPFWIAYVQRNQLLRNRGNGSFEDLSPGQSAFCGTPHVGRGLACGDLDNDGDLDLVTTSAGGPARIYENIAPKGDRHWLLVEARDPRWGGRHALGAEVIVRRGTNAWWGFVHPTHSYLSSNDPRVHFGLGPHGKVDALEVLWPDGISESFPGGPANRQVTLLRGTGRRHSQHQ